jgi:hypothetical protein
MTMGFKDDGDPPTGNIGVIEDSVEDDMDMEETTVPVVRKLVKKSGSRTSLSRLDQHIQVQVASSRTRTRTTTTTTSMTRTMGNHLQRMTKGLV